ncbi:MAG: hypothetical protein R3199_11805 [Gemmatimonadota bacterium]|nr:hypothetical protein [Gemmatimonadota bacterium]
MNLRSDTPRSTPSLLVGFFAGLLLALSLGAAPEAPDDVLRVKGLVVEDEEGRPRIVLGAPVARVEGRRRTDPSVGLLVLDENGVDRVSVGAPTTAPRAGGRVHERIGDAAGIEINDEAGNERAGFATWREVGSSTGSTKRTGPRP